MTDIENNAIIIKSLGGKFMKNNEKASFQILKITIISLILIFSCNIAVRAFNPKLNSVKIVLANNYEMNVVTTKTKVSEILEENHIVVLPTETVFPEVDSNISDDGKIIISNINDNSSKTIEIANEEETLSTEQILANHLPIVERKEEKEEAIPFETVTKDSKSINSDDRTNKVIQEGKDGIKKVIYSVKYQNDIEISRTIEKEEIIKKPVNKIIQVTSTTSRSSEERKGSTSVASTAASTSSLAKKVEGITPIVKTLNTSAYTAIKGNTKTASGKNASVWYTVAAGKSYPMGTIIYVPYFKDKPNGGWFVVQDRGGAIKDNKLDVYMSTEKECVKFGRRNLECYIYLVK